MVCFQSQTQMLLTLRDTVAIRPTRDMSFLNMVSVIKRRYTSPTAPSRACDVYLGRLHTFNGWAHYLWQAVSVHSSIITHLWDKEATLTPGLTHTKQATLSSNPQRIPSSQPMSI